jgi:hypothetical protein
MMVNDSTRGMSTAEEAFHQELYDLRPWYHDFARLGLNTTFDEPQSLRGHVAGVLRRLGGAVKRTLIGSPVEKGDKLSLRHILVGGPSSHRVNQRHKEQVIIPLLQQALEALGNTPSCLDLFCADGYYSCTIAHLCPDAIVTGVDLDPMEVQRAQTVARILGAGQTRFVLDDVWEFVRRPERYGVILCTGGLYHLREPRRLLELLFPICAGFLVIQSVVTLETEDANYFVSPAPGWKHGSRFTHAGLRSWLEELGWDVLEERRNELTGNPRPCDRGSSYFLCRTRGGVGERSQPVERA